MSDEAGEAVDEPSGDAKPQAPALVFLDPSLDEEWVAHLEEGLQCKVRIEESLPLADDFPCETDLAIIVPLDLGSVSGLDLLETIRRRTHGSSIPIAIASGFPTSRRVRAAMRAGASTWLLQPYELSEIQERLGLFLEPQADERGVAGNDAEPEKDAL